MNKSELVSAVMQKTNATKKDTEAAVTAVFEAIGDALKKKDAVQIIGFGTFKTRQRAARTARNPRDGSEIKVAACTTPAFTAGKGLKEKVNK